MRLFVAQVSIIMNAKQQSRTGTKTSDIVFTNTYLLLLTGLMRWQFGEENNTQKLWRHAPEQLACDGNRELKTHSNCKDVETIIHKYTRCSLCPHKNAKRTTILFSCSKDSKVGSDQRIFIHWNGLALKPFHRQNAFSEKNVHEWISYAACYILSDAPP